MNNRIASLLGAFFIMQVINLVELEHANAQLGKIHRSAAQISVAPALVIQDGPVAVTVQRFDAEGELRVRLCDSDGVELESKPFSSNSTVFTDAFLLPGGADGDYQFQVIHNVNGSETVVAETGVTRLDGWLERFNEQVERIEAVESQTDEDPLRRAAWAALAFAEDALERAKRASAGEAWDLRRRLTSLKAKADMLEKGRDPLGQKSGYQLRGYRSGVNDEIQLYSLYAPKDANDGHEWPLVIMLHGAWSNHHLALRRVFGLSNRGGEDDTAAKKRMPQLPDVPYLVAAPNGFETSSYEGYAEEDVWRVIDEVKAIYPVDENRVYLTGLSMGGGGTMKLAFRHPDVFAAAAPVCGAIYLQTDQADDDAPDFQHTLLKAASVAEIAENMLHTPVYLMHGDKDPVVPVSNSTIIHGRLSELGYETAIDIYPGVDHAAWVPAYENARIFDWFASFERDPFPKNVIYRSGDPRGGGAWWAHIDEPQRIRRHAQIKAQAEGASLTVTTSNVERLTLEFPEPVYYGAETVKISIDGQPVPAVDVGSTQHYRNANGQWKSASDYAPDHILPARHGLHAAVWDRHVYAFGSEGGGKQTASARTLAMSRSLTGGNVDVQWPVYDERELTDEIMSDNHVVLVATVDGSSFLKTHLPDLPIHVTDKGIELAGRTVTPDQGLAMIVPNPANPMRYLLLLISPSSEGLQALRHFSSTRQRLRTLAEGDFVVIGPRGHYIWGGLFDKNWQVSETGDFPLKD